VWSEQPVSTVSEGAFPSPSQQKAPQPPPCALDPPVLTLPAPRDLVLGHPLRGTAGSTGDGGDGDGDGEGVALRGSLAPHFYGTPNLLSAQHHARCCDNWPGIADVAAATMPTPTMPTPTVPTPTMPTHVTQTTAASTATATATAASASASSLLPLIATPAARIIRQRRSAQQLLAAAGGDADGDGDGDGDGGADLLTRDDFFGILRRTMPVQYGRAVRVWCCNSMQLRACHVNVPWF
jgi:hypothetical protein